MAFLSSAPLPAFTLLIGCLTGIASSRTEDIDAVRSAPAPVASLARSDGAAGPIEGEGVASGRTIYRSPDGLFYLTARVNGVPVRFLIDTGASVMVLRARDAAAVGAPIQAARGTGRIEGVGGSTAMAWTHIDSVAVGGREVGHLRAAVARRLPVSLLGQNLLSRLGPLHFDGDRLDLG